MSIEMNLIIESMGRPIEKDFSKTSVAHARNSVILSDIINADIITGDKDIHLAEGKAYKNIICCYASPYMKYKKLIQVVRDNPEAKLWWFVNDHDLEDNILLRNIIKETNGDRKINMVCNNSRENYRGWIRRKKMKNMNGEFIGVLDDFIIEWHTLNLNAMIYSYSIPYEWNDKIRRSIYYGTMRKWRLDDLIEYQKTEMILSATKRTQQKFFDKGVTQCQFIDKLSWQKGNEQLSNFMFSLYIEDTHTHTHYAHMANRYYESLMCNVVTIFDEKCRRNIEKSGFKISDKYIVKNAKEYLRLTDNLVNREKFEEALKENETNKIQAQKEHNEVVSQLKNIFVNNVP